MSLAKGLDVVKLFAANSNNAYTAHEVVELTIASLWIAETWLREMHDIGLVHVAAWNSRGHPCYRWGAGPDVPAPNPRGNHEAN